MRACLFAFCVLTACAGPLPETSEIPSLDESGVCRLRFASLPPGDVAAVDDHPCADEWRPSDGFGPQSSFRPTDDLPWWLTLEVAAPTATASRALLVRAHPHAPGGVYTLEYTFHRRGSAAKPLHGILTIEVHVDFRETVELRAGEGGWLERTPCGLRVAACRASYPREGVVRAAARADVTHRFMGWDCDEGAGPELERAADGAWSCLARFERRDATVALDLTIAGEGGVLADPASCDDEGRCLVPVGEAVSLEATPSPGWVFAGWSSPDEICRGDAPSIEVRLGRPGRCTARFRQAPKLTVDLRNLTDHRVRVITAAGAAVECESTGEVVRCEGPLTLGREVIFEARAFGDVAVQWTWMGDCEPTSPRTARLVVVGDALCVVEAVSPGG